MKQTPMTDALWSYLDSVTQSDEEPLQKLRGVTAEMPMGGMQIPSVQGRFMQILVRLLGARRCLEIGCFTGYSAATVALALPEDGSLLTCDVSSEWTGIARDFWKEAGVEKKIELRLAPALDTLQELLENGQTNSFDLAFIDADKGNYVNYYELCMQLVRPGGVILIDNTLWGGAVADVSKTDPDTQGIRAVNSRAFEDPRTDSCLLPFSDGLHFCLKLQDA